MINQVRPTLSIIIATFNAGNDIQKCLNSIKKQTYSAIEVIVIDGGSTDDTLVILERNRDIVTYWQSEADKGIYDALNKGLDHLHGDWVYFLGADDELYDDFSTMAYELKDSQTIYYGSTFFKGMKYIGYVDKYLHAKIGICHQAIIYPAIVFKKYKYNLKYDIAADRVLNMQCYKDKMLKFQFLDYIIAYFADTGVSSKTKDALLAKNKYRLILKYFGLFVLLKVFRKIS